MEAFFTFAIIGLVIALLVAPIAMVVSFSRIRKLQSSLDTLSARVRALELQPPQASTATQVPRATQTAPPVRLEGEPAPATPRAAAVPPPLPAMPLPQPPPQPAVSRPPAPAAPAIDWESFLGVKLFAWIGGFVLFLGVVFLVQYSFANNLITPAMRVAMGFVIGLALIAAGWFTSRKKASIPGQSLCATGVLVLYAAAYGAHAFYGLISLTTAFLLMSTVTVAAFALAVTLHAQVVVVLGLLGGFITPPLLTSGEPNPLLLFGYVALLNFGVASVVLRKGWNYLILLAALGTVFMQWAWAPLESGYARAGFWVFLALQVQFLAFAIVRSRTERDEPWSNRAALTTGFSSFAFALFLLRFEELAQWPAFFFGFLFLADAGVLALAARHRQPAHIAGPAGLAAFLVLALWTAYYLTDALLWWALGAYLLFAVLHAAFSVWPKREAEEQTPAHGWNNLVPLLAFGLFFITVWNGQTSFAVWSGVLLLNLVVLGLAWSTRSTIALVAAIVATLGTAGLWIVTAPPLTESVFGMLMVIGGFGVFFATAATFLTRQLGIGGDEARKHVPALAAAMPFLLLMMVIAKLPVPDPALVFGVALLLAIVLLGLGIVAQTSWIALVALGFTWAVERQWQSLHYTNASALLALGWYIAFLLVFAAYPFFSREKRALTWAISALSGVLHYWLVMEVVVAAYPPLRNGLLPAVFVLPYALGVWHLLTRERIAPASGDARLAWQGGAALLFVSLIFPVQFEREWITLGWAVEGLALLVLFRFVPNGGLRLVGAVLLSVAFVRLALNPAVLEYHPRTATRLWNWYLYAYGLTSACLLAGAWAVQPFRETQLARVVPRLLYTLGAVLLFLLLNIQIADYFSPGPTLTFSFTGNFARDMTYSIAWALFAFALLLIGMRAKLKVVRYAGVALLLVTLLKLFVNDLANLGQLYRIGAFIGVALVLIVASFLYQRFLSPAAKEAE